MEQKDGSSTSGLEKQLRGMILGNVRIGNAQADHHNQPSRGRGRGRGQGSWGDSHQNRPVHGQERHQQNNPPSSSAQPRRGGPADFRGRGYHAHGIQNAPQNRQSPDASQMGPTPSTIGHAPRILHRPQDAQFRGRGRGSVSGPYQSRPLGSYQARPQNNQPRENSMAQIEHLDRLAAEEIPRVEMSLAEFEEKEAFRARLEDIFQQAFKDGYPADGDIDTIFLVGFGSLASGFGMPGSDMDLAVVPRWKNASQADQIGIGRSIPRMLERAVLDAKMGGRLLTRTRVPILKVCERPTEELYTALCEERNKWNELPEAEQYPTDAPPEPAPLPQSCADVGGDKAADVLPQVDSPAFGDDFPELGAGPEKTKRAAMKPHVQAQSNQNDTSPVSTETLRTDAAPEAPLDKPQQPQSQQPRTEKAWMREKVLGPLDFPKQGVGIQCDINFENPLGIHNTHMLRCYSMTDPRVRPIVLFVKAWAKRRKINSSYSGTLSSYGWVLMVLHYLVNIAQPPVCPNLQHATPQPRDVGEVDALFKETNVAGYAVRFWRNEQEIMQAAQSGKLSQNRQSIGGLLRGFFQYYASLSQYNNYGQRVPQFFWTSEVLSLRTSGGIRTKQEKNWVSAKTTITAEKKVTNRYLFAIEDPFELDHNVARTVTHRGIVAIRDEFRRAWRILTAIGRGMQPTEGGLFDEVIETVPLLNEEVKKMGSEKAGVQGKGDGTVEAVQNTSERIVTT